MRDVATGATTAQLVALFERAIDAMWQRAQLTLGEVTLAAIVDRVLYTAAARFPALAALKLEPGGVDFDELRARAGSLKEAEFAQAVQFALLEFLSVLGHLTAEILSPALHAELSRVTLDDLDQPQPEAPTQLEAARRKLVRSS
jgi:hypothetical protein